MVGNSLLAAIRKSSFTPSSTFALSFFVFSVSVSFDVLSNIQHNVDDDDNDDNDDNDVVVDDSFIVVMVLLFGGDDGVFLELTVCAKEHATLSKLRLAGHESPVVRVPPAPSAHIKMLVTAMVRKQVYFALLSFHSLFAKRRKTITNVNECSDFRFCLCALLRTKSPPPPTSIMTECSN